MTVRKKIYVILAIIVFLGLAISGARSFKNFYTLFGKEGLGDFQNLEGYTSSFGGYSLLIPSNWVINENDSKYSTRKYLLTSIYSTSAKGSIAIYKMRFPVMSIEEMEKWEMENLADYDQFHQISTENEEFGVYDGYLREFSYFRPFLDGGSTFRCYDWVFNNGDQGYMFTMCSEEIVWNNIAPTFIRIIESIQVK